MIGLGALEARQERVMDVDHSSGQPLADVVGEDLHIAREDDEIDVQ